MKSKLFLSLSLLTAIFSVKADALISVSGVKHLLIENQDRLFPFVAQAPKAWLNKQTAKAALPFAGLVGATAATTGLVSYMQPVEQKPVVKSYFQMAQDGIVSGYNTVTTTASDLYNKATVENMKSGVSFVGNKANENRLATAGIVAGTVALGYGAYKLYNTDFSGKAKQTPTLAPAKPAKRLNVVRNRSPYCGRA